MSDKASAQTSAGSDSVECLGVAPLGGWAGPRPSYPAPSVAESTRTRSAFPRWPPWQAKAGSGAGDVPGTKSTGTHSVFL